MISIKVDTRPFERALEGAAKQIPFATARALTLTAQAAQAELRNTLAEDLTIRNDWVSKGIRIVPARKSNLRAEVGSRDRFMALQAEGGWKEGKAGGAVAVPVGARSSPKSITRPSRWPGKIIAGAKGLKIQLHGGAQGVFQKRGGGRKAMLALQYVLVKRVHVAPQWNFARRVDGAVAKAWPELARRAIAEAIDTSRKRAKAS